MSPRPTQDEIYDLSDKIEGIKPLPGFARFRRSSGVTIAPLLGFKSYILLYLLNQLEPPGQFIFPIIGVPGFRLEYPFETYWANRTAFVRESQAWKKVLLAPANCPFATLGVLEQLLDRHSSRYDHTCSYRNKASGIAAVVRWDTRSR